MDEFENEYAFIREEPEKSQPQPEFQPKQPKKKRFGAWIAVTAICCSILGGALGAGGVYLLSRGNQADQPDNRDLTVMVEGKRDKAVIQTVAVDTSRQMTDAEVYAANVNSTVGITTSITTNYWGFQTTSAASGSGFIISTDGYILTNYHVIESSDSITVSLYNGQSYPAQLIGYDESNDIAVLKIEAEDLTPVVLGDSDQMNVGDSVVAIGNPLGELTFSLTSGKISAKDRQVTLSGNVTMNLFQTDCAINSGNSGGALFNLYGEVVGVTNAKYSGSTSSGASIDNIGFAIPINSIRDIVDSIIEKGYISKPYIGVYVSTVSEQMQLYGVPAGAAVQSTEEDSPARQAGLQAGDVITEVNGVEITDSAALGSVIADAEVGDKLTMHIYRQGENMELTVTVGEKVQSALQNEQTQQSQQGGASFGFGGFGGRQ